MPPYVAKKLVQHRTWVVAGVNAAITWTILIIAPLGLFAVIVCTLAVFFSSLIVGRMCDRALFQLIRQSRQREVMSARRESDNINLNSEINSENYLDILIQERQNAD
jgi:hypothetical protein